MATRNKAQGTIEYLVIIAIVVVIALVVVGLLLQVMNQGSGIPETTAKTAWKSAEPWAIVDWTRSTTSLTVVLKNNTFESMNFNDFNITATDSNITDSDNVAPGATITKTIAVTCTSGSKYSYPKDYIQIGYDSATINGKVQKGTADIVGTCA